MPWPSRLASGTDIVSLRLTLMGRWPGLHYFAPLGLNQRAVNPWTGHSEAIPVQKSPSRQLARRLGPGRIWAWEKFRTGLAYGEKSAAKAQKFRLQTGIWSTPASSLGYC